MRQPQQQNRRGRGRGGRKPQNPLQRGYESNGPDVKIRGNASHIAEKYITLARDALSSGETILAENYLQHAEHYNRIIAAAQPAQSEHQGQGQGQGGSTNGHHNNHNNGQNNGQGGGQGGTQNRNRRPESAPVAEPVQEAAPEEKIETPVTADAAPAEEAPKPRRKRAPRVKKATDDSNEKTPNPGPVRMGDAPADEVAS